MNNAKNWIKPSSYGDQLQSPEWAKYSANMRRGQNCCQICRMNKPLQVHHVFYEPDRKLHEYSRSEVMVICAECHKEFHAQLKLFRKVIFGKLNPQSFRALNFAIAIGVGENDPLEFAYAMAELAADPRLVKNFCRAWTERKPKA